MSTEQAIRETAYAIWEAEGRPDGQDEAHWSRAEQLVEEQALEAVPAKKPASKKDPILGAVPILSIGGD